MKTITLHLTFSAVVLEILCSLSQLEERLSETSNTHTPQSEERPGSGGPQGGREEQWKDGHGPQKPDGPGSEVWGKPCGSREPAVMRMVTGELQ